MKEDPSARPFRDGMNVLFLYTELAPYVLACLQRLADRPGVKVHVVHWPVNSEAPFDRSADPRIALYDRATLTDEALLDLVRWIDPAHVFVSGWIDRGYLKACRAIRTKGGSVVLCSDTAWRGGLRQWANVVRFRMGMRSSYTHAWVTGDEQADYVQRLGFTGTVVRTGFYCADTPVFTRIGAERPGSGPWPRRFLCVARYIPTKGHQMLCEAFAELCEAGEAGDHELWIAGTGALFDQVSGSVAGRHPRITHLGFKQPAEMKGIVLQCGVFILPSLFEPWGVVVQEHACAGMPLILSSAVGAAQRFLVEGENGTLFRAGDKDALKKAMRELMHRSDAELRAMGARSAELGSSWHPDAWADTALELMTGDRA